MRCRPLDAPFGVRVELDDDEPLSPTDRAQLRRLFDRHGLIVMRGCELSADRQIELVSALGRIEPDASGQPMRMEVTNQHDRSTAPDGELVFHFDYAYDPTPISAISMYGETIEAGATATDFVSSRTILEELPDALLEELRGREAAHACFLYRLDAPEERSSMPDPLIERGEKGWGPDHYWTRHPVLRENSAGDEVLFVCLQHTDRLLGMSRAESDGRLAELYDRLYAPERVYRHAWAPHDLVIWDNLSVQHARPEPNDRARTLRRFHVSETDLTEDYVRVARERGLM